MPLRFARFSRLLPLLAVLFALPAATSAAGTTHLFWHWSNPLPFGNNIADLVGDSNHGYLAVADHGQAFVSEDLATWTPLDTGTRRYFRAAVLYPLSGDTNAVVITGEEGLIIRLDGGRNLSISFGRMNWIAGDPHRPRSVVTMPRCLIAPSISSVVKPDC